MSNPTRVPLIFGAAAFGAQNTHAARIHTLCECQEVLDLFVGRGHRYIDTARIYGNGTPEEFLNQLNVKGARIDTKIYPAKPGDHAPDKLRATFDESRKALGQHKIRIFYLHAPDRSVPFEDTLRVVNDLHNEGFFEEFGLSNFHSWEVAEIVGITKANGWVRPTVYQGLYNALERSVEIELIPCLRKFGLQFYAYSPLAGGLLAGTVLTKEDFGKRTGSRWDPKVSVAVASMLQGEYAPLLPILSELKTLLEEHNICLSEAAQRWLQHHSILGPQDGVVIGASSVKHVVPNMVDCEGGPLPEEITRLIDEAWMKAKGLGPYYAP